MYRFLKTQYVSLPSVYFSPPRSPTNRLRLCSFCKVYHPNTSFGVWFIKKHYYATTINDTEIYYPIKTKSRKTRKYTELLEVTDQVTNNTKAAVKRLNASHLSMLVNQPDVTLDKLHKFKESNLHNKEEKDKSTNNSIYPTINKEYINIKNDSANLYNFESCTNEEDYNYKSIKESTNKKKSDFSIMTDTECSHIINNDICNTIKSRDEANKNILLQNKQIKPKLSEVIETNLKRKKEKKNFSSERSRNLWLAQMEVYVTCKMFTKAQKLIQYIFKHVNDMPQSIHINFCNILLEGYCMEKDINNILKLYNCMIKNSMISPQTYAIVFEYIGKIKNKILQKDLFQKMESDMINNNISFNDIFNKSKFKLNQVENILKAIQLFKPEFQPVYTIPELSYNCKLMNNISKINSRISPVEDLLSVKELLNCLEKQINQESQFFIHVKSIEKFNTANKKKIVYYNKRIEKLESSWKEAASIAFKRNLTYLERKESCSKTTTLVLHPFLKVLPPEKYVNTIMHEIKTIVKGSEYFTLSLPILYGNLGLSIYRQYEIETKKKYGILHKIRDIYHKYLSWYKSSGTSDNEMITNSRIMWQKCINESQHYGASIDKECVEWPSIININIGKFLYNIIVNDIKFKLENRSEKQFKYMTQMREIPAFYTLFRSKDKIMVEQVKPHPSLHKLYRDAEGHELIFDATLIPTLCPPRPWLSTNSGGYLISKIDFMRTLHSMRYKQIQILQNTPPSKFFPVLDALNQLGSVPWKVNTQVLDIIIKVFQAGGSVQLNVPQPSKILIEDIEEGGERVLYKDKMNLKQKMNEMHSLWCDCLYKLSLANHFRNEIFWLPHNIDFRGRAYPVPPHLTHLGPDLARSILKFANEKVLGSQGLEWLKLHTINLTGLMKRKSVKDRLKFANENLDKIIDSAENPLTGEKWWVKSDEPWQTLASCIELTNALKSPNPEKYVSGFPVHQDGSCNGLQHYAALGRDQIGAESVNLYPSNKPQDVYSVVATMVEDIRTQDAYKNEVIARVLEGHISRKVIKQTVMTTVYGVTKFGARLQIQKQLQDLEDFPEDYIAEASTYLASKTFESLQTMFTSAKTIQDWLTTCAHVISVIFNENVEWVTPLGLPIFQPYLKTIKHEKQNGYMIEKVDTMKQKNAFPPNFIHSLDSTHMMLTSLFCEQAGITFMSVHDCFWTHPCSVDVMNKICREQFVALHSQPILEDLSEFLIKRYVDGKVNQALLEEELESAMCFFKNIPKKGDFDLRNVLESTYFFS